jgi:hypothetical protein
VLIIQQFGINDKRVVDVANALVKETQVILKNIVRPDVNKQERGVI